MEKCKDEIGEKTDIEFVFDEIKTGRKVTSIRFYIKQKNKAKNEIAATLASAPIEEAQQTIDDISNTKSVKNIITEKFIRREVDIKEPHQIKFMESHANYGLQAVDMVIGTIRRNLHKEKKDEQNFKSIEPFIVSYERLYEKDFK